MINIDGRVMSDNEYCATQEPVTVRGQVVGSVIYTGKGWWEAMDERGRRSDTFRSRQEAIAAVRGWARPSSSTQRPAQGPTAAPGDELDAVGAFVGGLLKGLFGQ